MGFSMAMYCSTKVLKLICFFFVRSPLLVWPTPPLELESWDADSRMEPSCGGIFPCVKLWFWEFDGSKPGGSIRGGESFRKVRLAPQRVIWVSLFVCVSTGRLGLVRAAKERNEEEAVGDVDLLVWSSSSSSESTGLNTGEEGLRSEMRSSLMLRCLRMGLRGWGLRVGLGEKRSKGSWAEVALDPSRQSETGCGLGSGVQSTAVCRGP